MAGSLPEGLYRVARMRESVGDSASAELRRLAHNEITRVVLGADPSTYSLGDLADALGVRARVDGRRRVVSFSVADALANLFPFEEEELEGERSNSLSRAKSVNVLARLEEFIVAAGAELMVSDDVYVRPEDGEILPGSGGFEKKQFPRVELALEVVQSLGVQLNTCAIRRGAVSANMLRQTPYVAIVIPQYQKTVLVCNEEGNRTFVFDGVVNDDSVLSLGKSVLRNLDGVRDLVWTEPSEWMLKLAALLTSHAEPKIDEVEKDDLDYEGKMNSEYFSSKVRVKSDLEKFAEALKVGLGDLSLHKMRSTSIEACNGERVRGYTYVHRYAIASGLAKDTVDANSKMGIALESLLKFVGLESLNDASYYSPKNVRKDMEAFLKETQRKPQYLTVNSISNVKILTAAQKRVNGRTYLANYLMAIGKANSFAHADNFMVETLSFLLEIAGYKVEKYSVMDAEYYSQKNVKADLQAFADLLVRPVEKLTANAIDSLEIRCANGETLKGKAYLLRFAAVVLKALGKVEEGKAYLGRAVYMRALINLALNGVLELPAGFSDNNLATAQKRVKPAVPMNANYFAVLTNVETDLVAFAEAAGVRLEKLSTWTMGRVEITAANGELVKGFTYFNRYAKAQGWAKNTDEAQGLRTASLRGLMRMIGLEAIKHDVGPKSYFTRKNVRNDLSAIAAAAGCSLFDLNLDLHRDVVFKDKRGENVTFRDYLVRALDARNWYEDVEAVDFASALRRLMVWADIEMPSEYPPMDRDYFTKENVTADLGAFMVEMPKVEEIEGIVLKKMFKVEVKCANGEIVKGRTYMNRAARALGYAKDARSASFKEKYTWRRLMIICGICTKEWSAMDKAYFEDSGKVTFDLDGFEAKVNGDFENGGWNNQKVLATKLRCHNDDKLSLETYLRRAAIAFGFAGNSLEAKRRLTLAMSKLLAIRNGNDVEIVAPKRVPDSYYLSEVNVREDLKRFAKAFSCEPGALNFSRYASSRRSNVMLGSGEEMSLRAFVGKVAVLKSWVVRANDANSVEVMRRIKAFAGIESLEFPPMDEQYFSDVAKVKADMSAYLKAAPKAKSLWEISPKIIRKLKVVLSNGEDVQGRTYIHRAGIALGYAETTREAQTKEKYIWRRLLIICGLCTKEWSPMDAEYWADVSNIDFDLRAFELAAGANFYQEMAYSRFMSVKAQCFNDDYITFESYLTRAGVRFGFAKTAQEAKGKRSEVFNYLLSIRSKKE